MASSNPSQTPRSALAPSRGLTTALLGAAAAFAAMALLARKQARETEARHPPMGRFATVHGRRLHLLDQGQGRPILLLHGAGNMVEDWGLSILNRLARGNRAVAVDRPGYGYSERDPGSERSPWARADFWADVILSLGLDRPLVVAHSFGCLEALALAIRHPESVRGLVLMSGYVFPEPNPALMAQVNAWPVLGPLLRNTVNPLLGRGMMGAVHRRLFAPNRLPAHFRQFPGGLTVRPGQLAAYGEEMRHARHWAAEVSRHYDRVNMPVTILAGEADQIVDPYAHSLRLHQSIPHSELEVLPNAGHMIHHVQQDQVVDAIAASWLAVDLAESALRTGRMPQVSTVRH